MIEVKEKEDGSFDIFWDENDPSESMFNTWTEQDFIEVIQSYLEKLKNENNTTS